MSKSTILLLLFVSILVGFCSYRFGFWQGRGLGSKETTQYYQDRFFTSSQSGDTLWRILNDYKQKNGLPVLKVDNKLCEYANERSKEVLSDWSHAGFIKKQALVYNKYCPSCVQMGENLARDFTSAEDLMYEWIKSPSHKEILDTHYTKGCLGINENNGSVFVSLIVSR